MIETSSPEVWLCATISVKLCVLTKVSWINKSLKEITLLRLPYSQSLETNSSLFGRYK